MIERIPVMLKLNRCFLFKKNIWIYMNARLTSVEGFIVKTTNDVRIFPIPVSKYWRKVFKALDFLTRDSKDYSCIRNFKKLYISSGVNWCIEGIYSKQETKTLIWIKHVFQPNMALSANRVKNRIANDARQFNSTNFVFCNILAAKQAPVKHDPELQ